MTVAVVMAVLSVGICVGVWKTGSAGLNEIQAVQEDVQFYYTTDFGYFHAAGSRRGCSSKWRLVR